MTADTFALPKDSDYSFDREWLETNGLGGWASSTVSGTHTRRYHGLLVVATQPPVGRVVLLSRLDETLVLSTRRVELSCSIFPGVIHPRGDQWLTAFASEPVPTWTYAADGWELRKRLAMLAGEHALVVAYELVKAPGPLCLELRPLFAGRDYHHLMQANDQVTPTADWAEDALVYRPYPGQPTVHLLAPGACWEAALDWYYNFHYPREEERGLDHSEDLFTPGRLRLQLAPGATVGVVAATELPACRDPLALLADEIDRRQQVEVRAPWAADPLLRSLARAANQFLVDVVAPEGPDWAIRPNQVFALSLPFSLIEGERARRILSAIDQHLLTPRGLRSLSPSDPAYCAQYAGGPWERDSAYHQGTVWGWLIGPYITALCRCHGRAGRQRSRALLDGFAAHLREAGLGTVSEIFDAEPPFAPRGCIAQAWSVAELLRAGVEDVWELSCDALGTPWR